MSEVHEMARQLYEACPTVKPSWDQIGDVTKSVWIERVQATLFVAAQQPTDVTAHTESKADVVPAGHQASLF